MYSSFQLTRKFIRYFITASNGKGHGIHSPFVFDFITQVLNDKRKFYAYSTIENCRNQLLVDERIIAVDDFGAGSVTGKKRMRKVAGIVKNAAKSKKLGQLLFRIANHYKPAIMVELGTSLGLSAAYLASGSAAGRLITCEGAEAISAIAKENFSLLGLANIEVVTGNFDETLVPVLKPLPGVDLAFIDGNHRAEPTLRYFRQLLEKASSPGIIIFDDIHWSTEMETAWEQIKAHPKTMLTIDLFFIGLVFFSPGFKIKQHFVIRF